MMSMQFFYMEHDFYAGQFTKTAFPKFDGFNETLALWFITWLNRSSQSYKDVLVRDFEKTFNNTEITLPITTSGDIDFKYMQDTIHELEQQRIHELETYLIAAGFTDCNLTTNEQAALNNLPTQHFKLFKIGELFNIKTGRDIIIGQTKDGDIPLISHQHENNGISKYIAHLSDRTLFDYKTTIPLADRGVFLATTQNQNFHIGTRVKALTFKDGEQTECTRLFFVTAINKLQTLFIDYLTNATDSLPDLEIALPTTPDNSIDYDFITDYINAIKKSTIQNLKDFIQQEHQAYLKAIN